ncbi:hypothetical protein [Undibacterium sp. Xuan67W]|uniref:hypothetical protein n=1 Tax=Undibacterium sp. Xuan67W TaxID=3413057 RepID=UPI003BF23070
MKTLTTFKMLISIITLSVVAIAAYFYTQNPERPLTQVSAPTSEATVLNAANDLARVGTNFPPKIEKKSSTFELAIKYSTTRDMRAFVEYAKQHPELGGGYYAAIGMGECLVVKDYIVQGKPTLNYDAKRSPEIYAKRQQAFESLKTLCQSFLPDEITQDALAKTHKQSIEKNDIFSKIISDQLQAAATADITQRLESMRVIKEKVMASKDPLLIDNFSSLLSEPVNQKFDTYWLDGKPYNGTSEETNIMQYAWRLVPCSLGLVCDETNHYVSITCLNQDICANSLSDLFRQNLERSGDKDGKQFQQVLQLQKRLTEIVQNGEFTAFKPKT